MNQDDAADADDRRDKYQKKLKADSQTQTEASDVYLSRLATEEMKAGLVFFFEVLLLDFE
jgi:hypothetical protein